MNFDFSLSLHQPNVEPCLSLKCFRARFTGLVDLLTMSTGALDVVFGATQCASSGGTGLPSPRIGIALKGDAAMAFYNLCKSRVLRVAFAGRRVSLSDIEGRTLSDIEGKR